MLALTQHTTSLHSDWKSQGQPRLPVLSYSSQPFNICYIYSFFTLLPTFTSFLPIFHVPKDGSFWEASLILFLCLGTTIINRLILPSQFLGSQKPKWTLWALTAVTYRALACGTEFQSLVRIL